MSKPARKKKAMKRIFVLGVRVDADLKTEIEEAAWSEDRSVSQWLALAARDALGKKGNQP